MSINTFSFSASTADKDKITRDSSSRIFTIFNYAPQLNAWRTPLGNISIHEFVFAAKRVSDQLAILVMQNAHAHKKKYCHCARLVAQFSPYVVVWQGHMLGFVCRQNTWKNVGSTR
ncbi:unnamed protein product [Peronospora belbahrii]|uniref:Uncharacterized protein n=1 Tax=Peronospora belbahrii TaxID=622444 RepID=A0ABN8CQV8_9STRA|nr:unnamed protein product [Peronospora belbahrii]